MKYSSTEKLQSLWKEKQIKVRYIPPLFSINFFKDVGITSGAHPFTNESTLKRQPKQLYYTKVGTANGLRRVSVYLQVL
jgi:hypothetical protein